jgi:hypothetical protein
MPPLSVKKESYTSVNQIWLMKYSTTIALFLGVASATKLQGNNDLEEFNTDNSSNGYQSNSILNVKDHLGSSGIKALGDAYLEDNGNQANLDALSNIGFSQDNLSSRNNLQDQRCSGSQASRHNFIDQDADRVNASYESCQVGETYIPALKEKTHVQQAASYASDSAAKYCIKGVANNNYKVNGSLSQSVSKTYNGSDKSTDSLNLHGNRQKTYN